jgi:hypothetical protein
MPRLAAIKRHGVDRFKDPIQVQPCSLGRVPSSGQPSACRRDRRHRASHGRLLSSYAPPRATFVKWLRRHRPVDMPQLLAPAGRRRRKLSPYPSRSFAHPLKLTSFVLDGEVVSNDRRGKAALRAERQAFHRSDHPGNGPRTMILRRFAPRGSPANACKPFLVSD